uniref:RNase H type-1 domain-containing protein n=1 Tax=Quercus lobata TaxID=97700 RepID=A0A7N2L7S4_QUELO
MTTMIMQSEESNPGSAVGGGIIRDSNRAWIRGFERNIGAATCSLNLSHVIVELDAKVVVSFLSSSSKIHPKLWALVNNRRLLLRSLHNALGPSCI